MRGIYSAWRRVAPKIAVRRGSEGLHLNIIFVAVIYICVEFISVLCEGWRKIVEHLIRTFQDTLSLLTGTPYDA